MHRLYRTGMRRGRRRVQYGAAVAIAATLICGLPASAQSRDERLDCARESAVVAVR
jgi:hypothetical protein